MRADAFQLIWRASFCQRLGDGATRERRCRRSRDAAGATADAARVEILRRRRRAQSRALAGALLECADERQLHDGEEDEAKTRKAKNVNGLYVRHFWKLTGDRRVLKPRQFGSPSRRLECQPAE